jgi:hypothetical protein
MREVKLTGGGSFIIDENGRVAEWTTPAILAGEQPTALSQTDPNMRAEWVPWAETAQGLADALGIEGEVRLEPKSLLPKREDGR